MKSKFSIFSFVKGLLALILPLFLFFRFTSPVSATTTRWVAVGSGTNSIAYSDDGINWTGLGTSIFSGNGYSVAWNGTYFVAVGNGTTNTIAYSSDGITWTGVGKTIFSSQGYGIAWNGTYFVAVGSGTNTIAYSSDGINWTGEGTSIFSTYGYGIAWNGTKFVASGNGTNGLAYSSDGINWTGIGNSVISDGRGIAWNGTYFVAVANSTNTIAYSSDGINWTGEGKTVFSTIGYGIVWNGTKFVAFGQGTNTIAYSSDGINWTGEGGILYVDGRAAAWDGSRFVTVGSAGTNTIAYSSDGINWTGEGTSIFSTRATGIASAPAPNLVPAGPALPASNTVPGTISDLSTTSDDSQVKLNWSAPSNGGAAITDYTVQYRVYGATSWTTFSHSVSTNTYINVTGLTNGTRYEFNVMAVNSVGTANSSNLVNTIPMGILFQDNFESRSLGNISGQYGWSTGGDGTWTVSSGDGGQMLSGSTGSHYYTHFAGNGSSQYANERVKIDFQATGSTSTPHIWLRRNSITGDGNGYFLDYNSVSNKFYIAINNGASGTGYSTPVSATDLLSLVVGNWYTIEFQVINNTNNNPVISVYLYAQGGTKPTTPFLTYTDTSNLFQSGYVAVGSNTAAQNFDNIVVYGTTNDAVTITSPAHSVSSSPQTATLSITDESNIPFYIPYIQTSSTLTATATVGNSVLPTSGGVKFVLNQGQGSQQTLYAMSSPFTVSFTNLAKGTYTLDAYIVDSSQIVQSGSGTHDSETGIGIGDIITAIGDSITMGYNGNSYGTSSIGNWLNATAGSISTDSRNYPQYGPQGGVYYKSFMTELNNSLTSYYGYPVFIMNEGWGGYKTSDYVTLMATAEWSNRQAALHPNKWLIDLGVNDAGASISTSTFQTNLQTIITSLINSYGATSQNIYLSRPNYATSTPYTTVLPTYLPIVDGLITSNSLSTGPDFYTYFLNHHSSYYTDVVHPNAAGFTQIARLNFISMAKPQNVSVSQTPSSATLTWNNLSTSEPTISGYKVKYGTTSGSYSTTVDVGNVTSYTVNNLTSGQTYYFVVQGYDNDAYNVNLTSNSTEESGPVVTSVSSSPNSSGATVTWTTNSSTSSRVDYGLTSSYGTSTTETDTSPRVTGHSVSLSGLASCITYHYRVRSKDSTGNERIDSDNTFTTSGCIGSATVSSETDQAITTASGGSLSLLDVDSHGLDLTVPASFAGSDANFQAHQLDKTTVLMTTSTPTGYSAIGSYVYQLSALTDNSTTLSIFNQPITVKMTYGTSDIAGIDESTLTIQRWDGTAWNNLTGCSVNTTAKTVTCTTTHFSTFILFGKTSGSGSSSSSNSSSSSTSCTDQTPGVKTPWLYGALPQSNGSVVLYFTPADQPITKYILEYGTKSGNYQYGVQDMGVNSREQMTFSVGSLAPNTTYYFRVRGQNGCATGSWSNEISATTKGLISLNTLNFTQSELTAVVPSLPAASSTTCKMYTVKSGDTLWSIAKNILGNGNKYTEMIDQNKNTYPTLATSNNLEVGWQLSLSCNGSGSGQSSVSEQSPTDYSLSVKVKDTKGKPIEGASVTIHSVVQTAKTDKDGIAKFNNVEAGQHKVLIAYNNYQGEESVNLTSDANIKDFNLNVTVTTQTVAFSTLSLIIIGVLVVALFGVTFALIKTRRKVKLFNTT